MRVNSEKQTSHCVIEGSGLPASLKYIGWPQIRVEYASGQSSFDKTWPGRPISSCDDIVVHLWYL